MFNKRHYEAIALTCQEYRCHIERLQTAVQRRAWQSEIENDLANMFARDNPRFDKERFLAACLPGANVRARTANVKRRTPDLETFEGRERLAAGGQ